VGGGGSREGEVSKALQQYYSDYNYGLFEKFFITQDIKTAMSFVVLEVHWACILDVRKLKICKGS